MRKVEGALAAHVEESVGGERREERRESVGGRRIEQSRSKWREEKSAVALAGRRDASYRKGERISFERREEERRGQRRLRERREEERRGQRRLRAS